MCKLAISLFLACGVVLATDSSKSIVESILNRFRRQTSYYGSAEEKCKLTGPLQNGRYYLNPKRCPPDVCTLAPGASVPSDWDLFYECNLGYLLSSTTTTSTCKNGRWYPELPTCYACGSSSEVGTISALIANGQNANIGSFPWHAGLYFPKEKNETVEWIQQCGGTLISPRFVATAAHCVVEGGEPRKKEDVRVAVGKSYRSWDHYEDNAQKRNVARISFQQRNYNKLSLYFDIALIMMDKKVEFGRYVMPVCTGVPYGSNYINDNKLYVSGWGRTQNGKPSDLLQYTDVSIVPREDCETRIPSSYFLLEKICTHKNGSLDVVVREGDSGGGLTVVYKGRHYIIGIVSLNLNQVTLFTNINFSIHKAWMEKEMSDEKSVSEEPTVPVSTVKPPSDVNKGTDCSLSETTANGKNVCSGKVIFEEDFTGPLSSKWKHHVLIGSEDQNLMLNSYDADSKHTSTSNGELIFRPTVYDEEFVTSGKLKLEGCTSSGSCELTGTSDKPLPPVATAMIHTFKSFYFRYGEVEIRAKVPVGDWLAPDLELRSKDNTYGSSTLSGYIYIVSRGNSDLKCNGENYGQGRVELWIVLGPGVGKKRLHTLTDLSKDWYDQYHTFTVIWKPESISFKVDGKLVGKSAPEGETLCEDIGFTNEKCKLYTEKEGSVLAPFDKDFFISVGLTAGNTWYFTDNCINKGKPKPWKNEEPEARLKFWQDRENWKPTWTEDGAALHIDYIRVTAL